jgi:hypothetical protein
MSASERAGSNFFSLSAPTALKSGNEVRLTGRECRLRQSPLLSPRVVRIEHLDSAGDVLATTDAPAPEIYRSHDQPCDDYTVRVAWTIARGDELRACFEHGRACPTDAATRAVA